MSTLIVHIGNEKSIATNKKFESIKMLNAPLNMVLQQLQHTWGLILTTWELLFQKTKKFWAKLFLNY